jgi:CRP/FNR family transcriptional regulator
MLQFHKEKPMPALSDLQTSASIPFFPALPRNSSFTDVSDPDKIKRIRHFAGGEVMFRQGEQPQGVFIVRRGTVKLYMTSSKGRVVILRIARPGEMLGLAASLSGEPCIAAAEALEDTEVSYVEREEFIAYLKHNPEAALSVAQQACSNYKNACRQVSLLGSCRSASERVAQFLLSWTAPMPGLTHEEISQAAGTTRETVTRTLADFRRKGWASLASSKLTIQNPEALEKLVA